MGCCCSDFASFSLSLPLELTPRRRPKTLNFATELGFYELDTPSFHPCCTQECILPETPTFLVSAVDTTEASLQEEAN